MTKPIDTTNLSKKDQVLTAYVEAINEIDDYFEYRNESKKDRERVHMILEKLTGKLSNGQSPK